MRTRLSLGPRTGYRGNVRGQLLTYLDHDDLPPEHNQTEQETRILVLLRKVCQQNYPEAGPETNTLPLSVFCVSEFLGHDPLPFP